jgi:hypothetical protein
MILPNTRSLKLAGINLSYKTHTLCPSRDSGYSPTSSHVKEARKISQHSTYSSFSRLGAVASELKIVGMAVLTCGV